jgi:predicted DsbA family dithiol-disulfide isomerase
MTRVEVFADIVCPFTHVGLRRFVEARAARPSGVRLRVRAWPLEWVNGRPLSPETAAREIDALRELVAPDLFAGFDPSSFPTTSVPAFGLVAAAYLIGDPTGEAVSLAVRDALFERGLDVTDPEVLHEIGEPYGVVPMYEMAAKAATRVDWERGKAKGVQGSPHFFVGEADWFCPSLVIRHEGDAFDIKIAPETMQEFYTATLG